MKRAVLPFLALALAGCATLDRGTLDDVAVVTDPPGALVVANTGPVCVSPCAVSVPRTTSVAFTISKPGYVTQSAVSNAKPDAPALATASELRLSADALGRAVDVQDGSYYRHVPKAIVVKLVPKD